MSRVVSCYNYRSKMQASSALVSFVGSEIPQTSLVFRSLIRTLAIAEGTSARKSSNKFGISLAYSYFGYRRRYFRSENPQTSLVFRSLIRTFAYSYAEA